MPCDCKCAVVALLFQNVLYILGVCGGCLSELQDQADEDCFHECQAFACCGMLTYLYPVWRLPISRLLLCAGHQTFC
jgi:hypothetical protein